MKVNNIFSNVPKSLPKELIQSLVKTKKCRIERIISKSHKTSKGKWYNQNKNEFVLILKGKATLLFKNKKIKMKKGDYLIIPKYQKHRVEKTGIETIWLAVFY